MTPKLSNSNNIISESFRSFTSAFADDTLWLGPNKEDIQRTVDVSNEFFTINDIKINGDKLELIVLNSSQAVNNNYVTMGDQNTTVCTKTSLEETRFLSIYLRGRKG